MDHSLTRQDAPLSAWWLIPPMAVGIFLRIWNIRPQILLDDEFHGLRAASAPYGHVLTHFGSVDHCIPLSLLYHFCASTVGLSEMVMRMPVLLFGILACILIPLLLRKTHPAAAVCAAWMLAISPYLVIYSRYCRPYGIAFTLMVMAILSAWRIVRPTSDRLRVWWFVFIVSLILAPWFHLSMMAPAGTLMLTLFLLSLRQGSRDLPSLARRIAPLAVISAGWCALFLPPFLTGLGELKSIATSFPAPLTVWSVLDALRILSGVSSPIFAGALGLLALGGVMLLWHRDRELALLLLVPALTQWIMVAVVHPAWVGVPGVCARYCILTLMLLVVAISFVVSAAVSSRSQSLRVAAVPAAGLLILAVFLCSGLPAQLRLPNNWTNCPYDQDRSLYQESPVVKGLEPTAMSSFYVALAQKPADTLTLIELPWSYEWWRNPYLYYQRVHRQQMKVGFIRRYDGDAGNDEVLLDDPRLRFRNFVDMKSEAAIRDSKADLIVVHKNHGNEVPFLRQFPNQDSRLRACILDLSSRFGAPVFEDEYVVVYAVSGAGSELNGINAFPERRE